MYVGYLRDKLNDRGQQRLIRTMQVAPGAQVGTSTALMTLVPPSLEVVVNAEERVSSASSAKGKRSKAGGQLTTAQLGLTDTRLVARADGIIADVQQAQAVAQAAAQLHKAQTPYTDTDLANAQAAVDLRRGVRPAGRLR